MLPEVPDGDHLPLGDGRVQLPHTTDVPRPLELLRVDEKHRLLDTRKGLVLQGEHPGVQSHATPEQDVTVKYKKTDFLKGKITSNPFT